MGVASVNLFSIYISIKTNFEFLIGRFITISKQPSMLQNKNDFSIFSHQISNSTNSSIVSSILTFRPSPSDDGTKLKCEGSNPRLPNSALEDTLIMNVMCKFLWPIFLFFSITIVDIRKREQLASNLFAFLLSIKRDSPKRIWVIDKTCCLKSPPYIHKPFHNWSTSRLSSSLALFFY